VLGNNRPEADLALPLHCTVVWDFDLSFLTDAQELRSRSLSFLPYPSAVMPVAFLSAYSFINTTALQRVSCVNFLFPLSLF